MLKNIIENIRKENKFKKFLNLKIFTFLIIVIAIPLTIKLTQENQEIRNYAAYSNERAKVVGYIIEYNSAPISKTTKLNSSKKLSNQDLLSEEKRIDLDRKIAQAEILKILNKKSFSNEVRSRDSIRVLSEFKYAMNGIALDISDVEAQKIKESPYVKEVYPDYEAKETLMDSISIQGIDRVWADVKDANNNPVTGKGINIGVIDSGIDYTHEDLGDTIINERSLTKITKNPISASAYDNLAFSIDENRIVYPSGPDEVTIYNFENKNYKKIDLKTPDSDVEKMVSGVYLKNNYLLYINNAKDGNNGLYLLNLENNQKKLISKLGPMINSDVSFTTIPSKLAISNGKVFYERQIPKKVTGDEFSPKYNVFEYDIKTSKERKLFEENASYLRFPSVSGSNLIYHQINKNNSNIINVYKLNLKTNEKVKLPLKDVNTVTDFKGDYILYESYGLYGLYNLKTKNTDWIYYNSPLGNDTVNPNWNFRINFQYVIPEGIIGDGVLFFPKNFNDFYTKKIIAYNTNKKNYKEVNLITPSGHFGASQNKLCFVGMFDNEIYCHNFSLNSQYPLPLKIYNSKVISGYNFTEWNSDGLDDNGHGTHVAGIIAGNGSLKGVAPEAKLISYKALNSMGYGSSSSIIYAIDKAVSTRFDSDLSNDISILNISAGINCGATYDINCGPDDPVSKAIDEASSVGIISVVAAGNSGPSNSTISSPATARTGVTVGAVDKNKNIAEFSSRGPVVNGSEIIQKPDIVAIGVNVCSAQLLNLVSLGPKCLDNSHITLSGTSMASPHVAGLAALILQMHPDWLPEQIKNVIKESADNLNLDENTQGAGLINGVRALSIIYSPIPTVSVVPSASPTLIPTVIPVQKLTLYPISDSFVVDSSPETNFGKESVIETDTNPRRIAYLKFNISELKNKEILSASLNLKVVDGSGKRQTVRRVDDNSWSETRINFNNRPKFTNPVNSFSTGSVRSFAQVDVLSPVKNNSGENLTFGITSDGDDKAIYYSRESSAQNRPKLIIEYR